MSMFGKPYTATAVYDGKDSKEKSDDSKKKGILNMPISTNIQIAKKDDNMKTQQANNSFDPFDPFDPFPIHVGERVQVDESGNIIGFGSEEKNEPAVEENNAEEQNIQNISKQLEALDDVPLAPVGEVTVAASSEQKKEAAPSQPVAATTPVAANVEITGDMIAKLSDELVPKVSQNVAAELSKQLSGKLSSQVADQVVKNMPTSSGNGEVKIVEPKITADALAEVVKQVTEAVSKNVKEQVLAQLTSITPSITGNVEQKINSASETVSKNVESKMGNVSDTVSKNVEAQLAKATEKMSYSVESSVKDLSTKLVDTINMNKPADNSRAVDNLSMSVQSMISDVKAMKDILMKPEEEISESELDKRINEGVEREKAKMVSHTITPLLISMIEARENILRMSQVYKEKGTDIPSGVMKGYAFDLGDALEKHKVEVYQSSKGDKFDPVIHKKIGTLAANKDEQDMTIAASLSCGYKYKGEVIFPEKVDIYTFKK